MSSHIVASRRRAVTSDADRRAAARLHELDTLLLTSAALCRRPGADPDVWYPIDESLADNEEYGRKACAGCPFAGLGGPCVERASYLPYDNYAVIGGTGPRKRRFLGVGTYEAAEVAA
ncbi:hypothetical protein ACQP25_17395 [Microtetraspora malaysiensis]|uniref:hypothetical protein n=1 Tax=Microtetraspora malaysiensis TaxID=161358 RepID=UPI003D8DB2CA